MPPVLSVAIQGSLSRTVAQNWTKMHPKKERSCQAEAPQPAQGVYVFTRVSPQEHGGTCVASCALRGKQVSGGKGSDADWGGGKQPGGHLFL